MKFSTLVLTMAIGSAAGFIAPTSSSGRPLFSTTDSPEAVATPAAESTANSSGDDKAVTTNKPVAEKTEVDMPIPRASAIVPNRSKIMPGRYIGKDNSVALPFMMRPPALDGTHAGDFGFDPMGFSEQYDMYTMQEAELRHARLAMLAVVGWPLSELIAPDWMLQQNGCAPSVLNGFNPITFVATAAIFAGLGFFEYKTALRRVNDTKMGNIHRSDMSEVWTYGVAGDYGFDPLDLYKMVGDDAYSRKGLRELEISHGRSAMLGITAFAMWEFLTGHPIVENSMFFHPNFLLPALLAGFAAASSLYEFEDSDVFIRLKLSSEGEARLENLKLGMFKSPASSGSEGMEFAFMNNFVDDAKAFAKDFSTKYDELQESYLDNVVKRD